MAGTASAPDVARQLLLGNILPSDITSRNNLRANAVALADQISKQAGGEGYNGVRRGKPRGGCEVRAEGVHQRIARTATHSDRYGSRAMATFKGTADALDNGDLTGLNHLGQLLGTQFGFDKATNFAIAREAFAGEVGKSLAGANVGVSDRNELRDKILNSSSPTQLKGFAEHR